MGGAKPLNGGVLHWLVSQRRAGVLYRPYDGFFCVSQ